MASAAGVEPRPEHLADTRPPRRPRAAPDPNDSEGPVLAAVGDLLRVHPKVWFAVRQNSGAMAYFDGKRNVPVWFYKWVRNPEKELTLTDYWGFLTDNRPFAIECKRPSWKHPSTDREIRQWNFINAIVRAGGIGSFVRSADEAKALLP